MAGPNGFPCQFQHCQRRFPSREAHYWHVCEVHSASMPCSFCSFHLDLHRNNPEEQLCRHLQFKHVTKSTWFCVKCWMKFAQKSFLLDHLAFSHKDAKETTCGQCGTILPSVATYHHHMATVHEKSEGNSGLIESIRRLNEEFDVSPVVSAPRENLVIRSVSISDEMTSGSWKPLKGKSQGDKKSPQGYVAELMCPHCQTRFDGESELLAHWRQEMTDKPNLIIFCEECSQPAKGMKEFRSHLSCLHKEQSRVDCPHTCPKCRYNCVSAEALEVHLSNFHVAHKCDNCHLHLPNRIKYSYEHSKSCKAKGKSSSTPADVSDQVQSLLDSVVMPVRDRTKSGETHSVASSKDEVELVAKPKVTKAEIGQIECPTEDTSDLYYGITTAPFLQTLAQINHHSTANQEPIAQAQVTGGRKTPLLPTPTPDKMIMPNLMRILVQPPFNADPKVDHIQNRSAPPQPPFYPPSLTNTPSTSRNGSKKRSGKRDRSNLPPKRFHPDSSIPQLELVKDLRTTLNRSRVDLDFDEGEVLSNDEEPDVNGNVSQPW